MNRRNIKSNPLMTDHLNDLDLELELLKRKREMLEQQQMMLSGQQFNRQRQHDYTFEQPPQMYRKDQYKQTQQLNQNFGYNERSTSGRNKYGNKRQGNHVVWQDVEPPKRFAGNQRSNFGNLPPPKSNQGPWSGQGLQGMRQQGPKNQHFNRNQNPKFVQPMSSNPVPLLGINTQSYSISQKQTGGNKKPVTTQHYNTKPNNKNFKLNKVTKNKFVPPQKSKRNLDNQRKHLIAESLDLVQKPVENKNAVLTLDQKSTQKRNGRLELALGSIIKGIKGRYSNVQPYVANFQSLHLKRLMKQTLRERLNEVMLGKGISTVHDIICTYREKYPKETDIDILNVATEAEQAKAKKKIMKLKEEDDPEQYFTVNMTGLLHLKLNEMFNKLYEVYKEESSKSVEETIASIDDKMNESLKQIEVTKPEEKNDAIEKVNTVDQESSDKQAFDEGSSDKPAVIEGSSNKPAVSEGSSDKPADIEGSSDKQAVNEGSSDKQAVNDGSSDKQAVNDGSSDKQAVNEGSSDKQAVNEGSSDKQAVNEGSSDKQAVNEGNSDEQAINEDSSDKQTVHERSSDKQAFNEGTFENDTNNEMKDENSNSNNDERMIDDEKDDESGSIAIKLPEKKSMKAKYYDELIGALIKRQLPLVLFKYKKDVIRILEVNKMYRETKATIVKNTIDKLQSVPAHEKGTISTTDEKGTSSTTGDEASKTKPPYHLPYYVKILGRPSLPKRKVMQKFLYTFSPSSIKKHKNVHNLLFIGFSSKENYENILAADGTVIGQSTLYIRVSERNDNSQNKTNNDPIEDLAENKIDANKVLLNEELDNQIADLLSMIRKDEEKKIENKAENDEENKLETVDKTSKKDKTDIDAKQNEEAKPVPNQQNMDEKLDETKNNEEQNKENDDVKDAKETNSDQVEAPNDDGKERATSEQNVDDKIEELKMNEGHKDNDDIKEMEETKGDRVETMKGDEKETGRATPTRASSRLANVTPSTIRTRRASRLAQNN